MCAVGDIILVFNYCDGGTHIGKHSFVVLNDEGGQIQGLDYDIICNVMSSYDNEEHKQKKLSLPGNFPIVHDDTEVPNGNGRDGYIKAEQFFYFNKAKTKFVVIGYVKKEIFELLLEFIESLDIELRDVIDNL